MLYPFAQTLAKATEGLNAVATLWGQSGLNDR